MSLKFDMNLEDVNSLYKFFGYFRDSMKFVSFYIDLNKHVLRPREREREREREGETDRENIGIFRTLSVRLYVFLKNLESSHDLRDLRDLRDLIHITLNLF